MCNWSNSDVLCLTAGDKIYGIERKLKRCQSISFLKRVVQRLQTSGPRGPALTHCPPGGCSYDFKWIILESSKFHKNKFDEKHRTLLRADSRLAPSQWETSLHSNAVSHWLGANLESALLLMVSQLWLRYCHGSVSLYLNLWWLWARW